MYIRRRRLYIDKRSEGRSASSRSAWAPRRKDVISRRKWNLAYFDHGGATAGKKTGRAL